MPPRPILSLAPQTATRQGSDDALAAAYNPAADRALMRGGSKTFFAASLLLPVRVREPATALYAFCRLADDAIDLGGDPHAAMLMLQRRLDALYEGRPAALHADRALAHVVHGYGIPREMLDAMLEGFFWDAEGRRYDTLHELHAYGARVAGTVGAMMSLIMDTRSPQALARACELGVAMQLTNIARDVGEDARHGRLYLPREWLREAGIDPERWVRQPLFDARLAAVIERLLDAANSLYMRSEAGIAALPWDCRPAIHAARLVYAEIGHLLARRGYDSIGRRTVVSGRRKLALITRALGAALVAPGSGELDLAPIAPVQFLVDAGVTAQPGLASRTHNGVPRRRFDERMAWMAELFERLAERDRSPR